MQKRDAKKGTGLDELFLKVGLYRHSEDLRELFLFIRKFPRLAPYNAFLIHIQKPGCQFVAEEDVWLNKYNRRVIPGSRPLVILWPFAPVHFVFDLEDTEGEPLPDEVLHPFRTFGRLDQKIFHRLTGNLRCYGIEYHEADYGPGMGGCIAKANGSPIVRDGGKRYRMPYTMIVNRKHCWEEKFATIAHELGHLFCGHLGNPLMDLWPDRSSCDLQVREFEAESVSWLVCERAGIYTPSEKYLSGYLYEHDEIPRISLESVLRAAGWIEKMMSGSLPVRKELRIKDEEYK